MKKLIITNSIEWLKITSTAFFLLFVVVLVLFSSSKAALASFNDRVVAVINDEVVTLYELEKAFSPYKKIIMVKLNGSEAQKVIAQNRKDLLEKLVADTLMQQEAKRLAVTVKAEDVEKQIHTAMAGRGLSIEDLEKELAKEGLKMEQYREDLSKHMTQRRLIEAEIGSRITISDEEIGGFYAENRQLYEMKESVRLQQIMLPLNEGMPSSKKKQAYKQMLAIADKLKGGEMFETLAIRYSQGPEAADGGSLGVVGRGSLLPVLEKTAFSLEVGTPSDIVESSVGLHILRVTEKLGGDKLLVQTIREDIIQRIRQNKIGEKLEEYIASLRRKANVEIRL